MKNYPSVFGPVYLEEDLDSLATKLKDFPFSKSFIIADSNTAKYCVPLLPEMISPSNMIIIPAGEVNKTISQCERIWSFLLEHRADRESMVWNVGGGMICDLGGFAASCYQRGIRFIHLPTSLLAMADAAIGGKVGVDFHGYKNYIGAFTTPEFIWVNPVFLQTLPSVEKINGLAEIVKHAIIGSRSLWDKLNSIAEGEDVRWDELLEMSIPVKVGIVEQDPKEGGMRRTLNFGHTIGHALESYFLPSDTPLTHGQCVTLGMLAESKMALDAGYLSKTDFEKINHLIMRLLDPPKVSIPGLDELGQWLEADKKNLHKQLSFSLPAGIGEVHWGLTGLDPAPALNWLKGQVSGKSFRLMSDPF